MMKLYSVLPGIVNMSLTAGIVVLAVLAARLFLKKAPKLFSYLLWGLVLFRLLCPVSFSSSLSAWKIFRQEQAGSSMEYIPSGVIYEDWQQKVTEAGTETGEKEPVSADEAGQKNTSALSVKPVTVISTWVWLAGMAIIMIYSYVNLISLRKRLAGAVPVKENSSKQANNQAKSSYVNIYETDCPAAPFVMGIIRPRIYLPLHLEEKEREYILLHEKTHIRRLDHIFKLLGFLALVIHWFNPLIWLAFRLAEKDMEMSCDESVMKHMEEDVRKEYSGSLLKMALNGRLSGKNGLFTGKAAGTPLAFGESDVKARVKNVMKYKKPAILVSIISIAVIAVLVVILGTNPDKEETERIMSTEKQESNEPQNDREAETENAEDGLEEESGETAGDKNSGGHLEQAAELADSWALAYTERNGREIASFCTEDVKKEFFGEELPEEGNYSFGYSSPWPWAGTDAAKVYRVTEDRADILYYAQVSDPHVTVWREKLTFSETDGRLLVSGEELHCYDYISAGHEFYEAYPAGINNTLMDYRVNGLGEALNNNAKNNRESEFYALLFEPAASAKYLLNLLDNENKVLLEAGEKEEDGSVPVKINFTLDGMDKAPVTVKMIQPWGEDGIWIPQDYVTYNS